MTERATSMKMVDALADIEAPLEDLSDFMDLSRRGLRFMGIADKVLRPHSQFHGVKQKEAVKRAKMIKSMLDVSERAQRHEANDFQYLVNIGIIQLWTAFDASLTDFILARMEHEESWKLAKNAKNMKVKAVQWAGMSEAERLSFVFEHLLTATGARSKGGVKRFELVLAEFSLSGPVPKVVGKWLLWLAETRHLLVHRQGIVDSKFATRCAWAQADVGTKLNPTDGSFRRARLAARAYVAIVGQRLEAAGLDIARPARAESLSKCMKHLERPDNVKVP